MRRSPAKLSKLSSPLPLDLHVLSLSLAFILSQDQTLRCYYLFFKIFSLILVSDLFFRLGFPAPLSYKRASSEIDKRLFLALRLLTSVLSLLHYFLSIVSFSMSFSLSSRRDRCPAPKATAKLHRFFRLCKFFISTPFYALQHIFSQYAVKH